jgi:hypothetical protein
MESHRIYELLVQRRCLVCEFAEEVWETAESDPIGPGCSRCQAPTERLRVVERRRLRSDVNPHAAALGRMGGLKGGPARAANLSQRRRHSIAQRAARARWNKPAADETADETGPLTPVAQ